MPIVCEPAPIRSGMLSGAAPVETQPLFTHRLATEADLPAIKSLMELAIAEHLKAFLDPAQVELSKSIMGLDTQLIADRTYFLVEEGDRLAGCGGWSRRATLYGGDHSTSQRNAALLDMSKDAARIRAIQAAQAEREREQLRVQEDADRRRVLLQRLPPLLK